MINTQLLGVDTGGTFTDFVLLTGDQLRVHKVLSTPHAPEVAILQGMRDLGLTPNENVYLVHGSTVATNAVLEGKGVRTAYITNRGLADVLSIGRQARRELYALQPEPPPLPVERDLCLETGGRLAANGEQLEPLTEADLCLLHQQLEQLTPEAVAINLLFSFLDDGDERKIEGIVDKSIYVSRSSSILPELGEYERGMTTWLNAYVGPLVRGYLTRLRQSLSPAPVSVMQSAGGTIAAEQAAERAVNLLLSGPAGGLAGAQYVAKAAGDDNLLSFDMGGTSTDVALLDGQMRLTSSGEIAGYPVSVPMVDMHTIGAGGGSIASVDAGGLLQVGPESAGAVPGPACYGQGGKCATVTDANLVLGRLRSDNFLGGAMTLDGAAASASLEVIAAALNINAEQAAEGVIRIANEHMARALRVISVQRGIDPRDYTLISFGGAGGLHVCALAEALQMRRAIIPIHGGVLSALGMLAAPRSRQLSQTVNKLLAAITAEEIEAEIARLAKQAILALKQEGVAEAEIETQGALDLCYRGQSYTFTIDWRDLATCQVAFHLAHQQRYGHRLDLPVELVNVRVNVRGPEPLLPLVPLANTETVEPSEFVCVYGIEQPVPVYERPRLAVGQCVLGPALITETVSTSWLARGWQARVHDSGCLLLTYLAND